MENAGQQLHVWTEQITEFVHHRPRSWGMAQFSLFLILGTVPVRSGDRVRDRMGRKNKEERRKWDVLPLCPCRPPRCAVCLATCEMAPAGSLPSPGTGTNEVETETNLDMRAHCSLLKAPTSKWPAGSPGPDLVARMCRSCATPCRSGIWGLGTSRGAPRFLER